MTRLYAVSRAEIMIAFGVLGLVAVLTIPRLGQAAAEPDDAAHVRHGLRVLRVAIERYHQDHGVFPGQVATRDHAAGTVGAFTAQLTHFTNPAGETAPRADTEYCFGPYLRDGIPHCPPAEVDADAPATGWLRLPAGWQYDCTTGEIRAATTAQDQAGRPYRDY